MDTRVDDGPSGVPGTGRHTSDAFICSSEFARDDESYDTGYSGTESADDLITFPSTSPDSSPTSSSTSSPQRACLVATDDDAPVPQVSENCKQSVPDSVEDCGIVRQKCSTSPRGQALRLGVEHQGHNDLAQPAGTSSGKESTQRTEAVVLGQESLSSSGRKPEVCGTNESNVAEKTNESTGNTELDLADSGSSVSTGTAVASEDTTDVPRKLVADPVHTPALSSPVSGARPSDSDSSTTAPLSKAENCHGKSVLEKNAQRNMPESVTSRTLSEAFESDKASSSGIITVLEHAKKQQVQELNASSVVSPCKARKRKLPCSDVQDHTASVPQGAKGASPSIISKAVTKRTMTQKVVCNWPGAISSTAKRRPTHDQLGRVYAKAHRAHGAKDKGSSANIPLSVKLEQTRNALSFQQNSTAMLNIPDGLKHEPTCGGRIQEKTASRQQSRESPVGGHREQLPFPCGETTSKISAYRSETQLPSASAAGGSTRTPSKPDNGRRVVIAPSRLIRTVSLPPARNKHNQHAQNESFPHIRPSEGFRTRQVSGRESPGCSQWNTNPFYLPTKPASRRTVLLPNTDSDPRIAAQASSSSKNAGRYCRTARTREDGSVPGAERSQSRPLDGRRRTPREPFFSEDPKENQDNHNPGWERFRRLSTDEERYEAVRRVWHNSMIPDPHCNLTRYYHRQKQRGDVLPTGVGAQAGHKRKASDNCDAERPAKRKRMDTEVYDLRVEQLERKTTESMYAARLALETKLQRLREDLQRQKAKASKRQRLKHQRSSTAPSNMSVWRQREQELQTSFRTQTEQIHISFASEIGRLLHARKEVQHFDKFYVGLIDSDPTMLSDAQMQEQLNIEKMLEHFKRAYGTSGN